MTEYAIKTQDIMKNITLHVTIKGQQRFKARMWLGTLLIKFGVWVIGTNIEFGTSTPKERIRPGINSAPPVAYDVHHPEFNPAVGKDLIVTLDNITMPKVVAYDTEDGWVEIWTNGVREKHTGVVNVGWKR